MAKGVPIDWKIVGIECLLGKLLPLLEALPRERWSEKDAVGRTLLHYACIGSNVNAVVALLQSKLVDTSACNRWGLTPAHAAACGLHPRVLEALCAAGADLRVSNKRGCTPIDQALAKGYKDNGMTARTLLANGVRLSTVRTSHRHLITPELRAFERGVLRCRTKVAALMRVRKAGKLMLWDKFLLKEIAIAVWATRY